MSSTNRIKMTIGGPESPIGSEETREYVIPHRGMPGLRRQIEKGEDPAVTGDNMLLDKIAMAGNVAGPIPLAIRPCGGVGQLLNSLLGQEDAPTQIGAAIRIRYTGTDASCKISANTSSDTLTSETGVKGSEAGDSNFGTDGDIDLTTGIPDTVGELVTVIAAYDDYECEKVFGEDSVDAADIIDITNAQAKDGWITVWFTSAASGIYRHQWVVSLTATERPGYSIQKDGVGDDYLYAGCVVEDLSVSAALKGLAESDCNILGMTETTSAVTASALTLEDVDPARFSDGDISIAAAAYNTLIRRFNFTMKNNHDAEGYGMGSLDRQIQSKGKFQMTGELAVRMSTVSILEKPKVAAGTLVNVYLSLEGQELATDINELMLFEMPYCNLGDFEPQDNNGVLDARIPFEVVKGKGTRYNDPLTVSILTVDSGAY